MESLELLIGSDQGKTEGREWRVEQPLLNLRGEGVEAVSMLQSDQVAL